MLRFATGAIAMWFVGCTGSELPGTGPEPTDVCEQDITAVFEPQPLGADPVWVEPLAPFQRPPDTWVFTNLWLAWNYNRASFYPIEEGDSVHFRFRFMAGVGFDDAEQASVLVFVEGRPVEVLFEGERVGRIDVPLVDGMAETSVVSLPPDILAPGLNQVNVMAIYRLNGRHSPTLFHESGVFSVANGSTEPQRYADTPAVERGDGGSDAPARMYRLSSRYPELGELNFSYANRNQLGLDDPMSLILRLRSSSPWGTSCPGAEERMAVVSILDGEPTSMGELDSIFTTVRMGQERVHRFERPLWSDGEEHLWGVFAFTGFGRPARQHHGGVASWVIGHSFLSFIQWAPD